MSGNELDDEEGPIKVEKENTDINNLIETEAPIKHENEKKKIGESIKLVQFPRMKYYLDCGFNLLVYGVGSKRNILNYFTSTHITSDSCLIINGFHSATNIKVIMN